MLHRLLTSNLGARTICAAILAAVVALFATPGHTNNHPGGPSAVWKAGPICGVNVQEHQVLPLLILNRDSIIAAAANMNALQRWYYNVGDLATMPLPAANDVVVTDTTADGHANLHERLRPLGQLALASGWSSPDFGSSHPLLTKAYGQSASPTSMALALVALLAFVALGKLLVPVRRRSARRSQRIRTA